MKVLYLLILLVLPIGGRGATIVFDFGTDTIMRTAYIVTRDTVVMTYFPSYNTRDSMIKGFMRNIFEYNDKANDDLGITIKGGYWLALAIRINFYPRRWSRPEDRE